VPAEFAEAIRVMQGSNMGAAVRELDIAAAATEAAVVGNFDLKARPEHEFFIPELNCVRVSGENKKVKLDEQLVKGFCEALPEGVPVRRGKGTDAREAPL